MEMSKIKVGLKKIYIYENVRAADFNKRRNSALRTTLGRISITFLRRAQS